jgi:thioredoxin
MGFLNFLKKQKSNRRLAIMDVNDASFQQQVIRRSYKSAVIVDYWAAWCGPCRHLGPILEKIAEEPDSKFILAKLDTEHNQKTASQYHIRSIPAVKAFRNGQIVDEFTGALPETLVRRFISKVSETDPPPARIKGSPNEIQRLKQARQHLQKGRGFEAFVLLNDFPAGAQKQQADQLLPLARFILDMDDGDGLTGLENLDSEYEATAQALHRRKFSKALHHLSDAKDAGEEIDLSYTNNVVDSILALLGEDNNITREYRQQLVPESTGINSK